MLRVSIKVAYVVAVYSEFLFIANKFLSYEALLPRQCELKIQGQTKHST